MTISRLELCVMPEVKPSCYIIAGPNGAGKTTFALRYLPDAEACRNFVNADMIAPICDAVICLDNTTIPSLIFSQDSDGIAVANQKCYQHMMQEAEHARTNP